MRYLSARRVLGSIAVITAGLMGYAFFAELVLGMEPCPLCMFQRAAMVGLGVVCLIGALHYPKGWGVRVYAFLGLLWAGLGIAIAGRHVWLQGLPKDQLPSCAPPLDYMWEHLPFGQMLRTVLMTSGECAEIDWQFLGFSMPAWVLAWFALMALVLLALMFSKRPPKASAALR